MPQYGQVALNTFVGGLLTEAGELTFPENASVDELNCDLFKDGSRSRRLGVEYEAGYALSTETILNSTVVSTHLWKNVGEQADTNFVVVQLGGNVIFFEEGDGVLSNNRVDTTFVSGTEYTLDLTTYDRPGGNGAETVEIQVASIKGALIIASPEMNTIYVTRDSSTGAFTVTTISFRVRDYAWQGDITTYDDTVTTGSVTDARIYDTKNTGWSDGPNGVGDSALTTYIGSGNYPPLTHPWYSGKNATGSFTIADWEKVYAGSTLIVNGHYVLDLYSRDRHTPSGIAGTALNTTESSRFSCVAGYSGRVFYSGMTDSTDDNSAKIYFSQQLVDGFTRIGDCHQVNDPTSEELSDLLDTDGGFITIPDAYNIQVLHTFGPDLYVFAENGVWKIGGVDDVFRATDYTVSKVTEDGLVSVGSFASAEGRPYWWSNSGIFTLRPTESGVFIASNVSSQTIQTYWEAIGSAKRALVKATFDSTTRRVIWTYPSSAETIENKRNEMLFFDEVLGAFFPWRISDQSSATNYISDIIFSSGQGTGDVDYTVVDSSGNQVQDSSSNDVIVTLSGRSLFSTEIKALVVDGATGSVTFADFTNSDFLDWGDTDYTSFAEGAYSFLGDMDLRKNVPYITTYMRTTETGWDLNAGGGYDPRRDSSCVLKSYWDFRSSPTDASGQEMYRRKYTPVVDTGDLNTFDYPGTVITSRLKVRGRGRVVRFRFESSQGKDFHLLGYSLVLKSKGRL